jgi:hypothetical protein
MISKKHLTTIKLINYYNILSAVKKYSIDKVKDLMRKTCINLERCNGKIINVYKSILCVQTAAQIDKLKIFYKIIINKNETVLLTKPNKNCMVCRNY